MFLPSAWGNGYCTEALTWLLNTYQRAEAFWSPYRGVYVRAIMGPKNIASRKVAERAGLEYLGVHKWNGQDVFLAGEWQKPEVSVCAKTLVLLDPKESSSTIS